MKPCFSLFFGAMVLLHTLSEFGLATEVAVITGINAPEIERYAAIQLCKYIHELYGIEVHPATATPSTAETVFIIGRPETNDLVGSIAAQPALPDLSDQGILLRPVKADSLNGLVLKPAQSSS